MSKDIRLFFKVVSKKPGNSLTTLSSSPTKTKSKKQKIIISDDEDFVPQTPPDNVKTKTSNKKRIHVLSSDSEEEKKGSPKKVKSKVFESKLKPVNIDDIFSDKTVKQSKVSHVPTINSEKTEVRSTKKSKKKKAAPELNIHDDEDFEKTLLDLDDDLLLENADLLDKTIEEALHKNTEKVTDTENKNSSHNDEPLQTNTDERHNESIKQEKKRQRKHSEESTPKKTKLDHNDSGMDPDQEAFEKKRYSAMLYQKYKNRAGPKHHGEKELPKGTPTCLKNLTFLRTGVLDSLEGDEFENLIKEHGGRIVHSVSRKVNYLVVGEEPGPAKLDKARGLHIPEISEDDLLDMILVKSGMTPKFVKNLSNGSADSGIEVESISKLKDLKQDDIDKKVESKENSKSESTESVSTFRRDLKHKNENKKEESQKKIKLDVDSESKSSKSNSDKPNLKKLSSHSVTKSPENKTTDINNTKVANKDISKTTISDKDKLKTTKKDDEFGNKLKVPKNDISRATIVADKPAETVSEHAVSWTEKYKPKDVKSIIGQQDQSSNMNKLRKWLMNWYRNQLPEARKKIPRPSPWAKNDDGAYYKAALLSGPPGVGKTTTATLLAKELGFDVVEFNASDTRSKKLLHEEVAQLLSTTTIAGYAMGQQKTTKKRVLLMDEVDGMAGNEDRGGIQELINLIKNTSVPIICMCNDRNHQKMRSLVNYCFDLRFNKPKLEQIRGAMMSICFKEGISILPNALTEIINGTGCDIRQTLNHLSMWSAADKNITVETAAKESKIAKKDTIMGPWEVIRSVFTESEQKNMTIADKSRLFFFDYSLGPLFVQENYLHVTPNCPKKEILKRVALAADSISKGDLIDSKIRSTNNWSLLEVQAMYSSVLPGHYMSGQITGRINFPGWLGKNSSATKHKRMLSELVIHTRTSTSGSKLAMKLDYLKPLRDSIIAPMKKYGTEGVHQSIEVMKAYNLLREDLNNLLELCQWKDTKNPFNDIEAKVKSAFTRAYNKEGPLLPFAPGAGVSKKKANATDETFLDEEQDEEDDQGDADDVTADTMIKVKSKDSKGKTDTKKASSSKGKGTSKGASKGKSKK